MFIALAFTLILSNNTNAQPTKEDSIWRPFRYFVGNWRGKGGGQAGDGKYERSYRVVLSGKFLEARNTAVYPPTEKNPKGETHEDVGYISYDKLRHTFVLRQFHVEGFVNQFAMDSISQDGMRITFTSESIENIPAGWKARETYDILSEDWFRETFELAPSGKEFEVYTIVMLERVK